MTEGEPESHPLLLTVLALGKKSWHGVRFQVIFAHFNRKNPWNDEIFRISTLDSHMLEKCCCDICLVLERVQFLLYLTSKPI